MPPLNIAIIGAGPAGCMLARLLLEAQLTSTALKHTITIFEAEDSPNFRAQGGTLDLHPKTGLAAIKAAGLYFKFLEHARFDGSAMRICDKNLKTWFKLSASDDGNPEIDRLQLRRMLLKALPEGTVKWGHKVMDVFSGDRGEGMELFFENRPPRGNFSLVIGADGGWSRTRQCVDKVQRPIFSGIAKFALTVPRDEARKPDMQKMINRGSLFAFGDGKSISGQQLGEGGIDVGLFVQFDDIPDKALEKEEVEALFADWSPELRDLVAKAEMEMKIYNLHHLPEGYRWEHKEGLTLLGDAAHLMTPFAGEGVNLAFDDAMKLSEAIIQGAEKGHEALDANIKAFEKDMFSRAVHAQRMTQGMMADMFFTKGAPRSSMQNWLLRRVSFDMRENWWAPIAYPFLCAAFFGGYSILRLFY
ncbi:hypothetical protein VTL71DRAFT_9759 [Oculimacula yallundae]|uniref:FAD-binding domain-containing protein n=1 Tax=Oculimacula yallundae TaxID=86028 RepID=A0ABR4BTI2_9HELO